MVLSVIVFFILIVKKMHQLFGVHTQNLILPMVAIIPIFGLIMQESLSLISLKDCNKIYNTIFYIQFF